MESIPWLSLTAASGGWTLFGIAGFAVLNGWLTPKITVTFYLKRIESVEAENRMLLEQNGVMVRELANINMTLTALKDANK